ncbi:MAG TPA: twin-arginine translocase TatA/TatE family subunit [Sedimentisphaerales bacterium]|nr:twin-arginine translocase TatA/TatE family subunit [Sedimentisphaerales bacterium]HNU28498.1 twin-arginine translocase TatA/TatE family subunit [Sedimentisphaerales bacterium]
MAVFTHGMAFISMPGSGEWIVILIIGLLIFGRRLPDVARSLGKSVNEFKKGMREFQDSADEVVRDVNKVTNEVASDVEKASGLNDSGYQDPNANPYGSEQCAAPASTGASEAGAREDPQPTDSTSVSVEDSVPPAAETPAMPDESAPPVESMK